jgi:hypothetical protein
MAKDLHRIPDRARGISVGRELLINNAQDYALAVSPRTFALAHASGSATYGGDLFSAKVEDFSDGKVDVVLILCAEGGGSAEDDELLFPLTRFHFPIVLPRLS